jgi:aminoglycoside 6-adenylyltransferase
MRSEQEMLALILETAQADARIRAVFLDGSRANPDAPRDIFQDFDIVYLVTEMAPFVHNLEWIRRFGELMILQMPEAMQDPPPSQDGGFSYLMQFTDGNRIDLGIYPLEKLAELRQDGLNVLLLDKDGTIEPPPPPGDDGCLPAPPSAKAFADCCNEFWWVCPYVAKGLWREEFLYARYMLDRVVRDELMKMLTWMAGIQTGFRRSPGKFGKYFQSCLPPETWALLLQTHAGPGYEATWEALFAMVALFRQAALAVAENFGFEYPHAEDRRVSAHLEHVRRLPRDAQEIY